MEENLNPRSSTEIINEMYDMFSNFKKRIEDPDYIQLENMLNQLMKNQLEMKEEMRNIKLKLLNPYDGIVVESRKNTEWREEKEDKEEEYDRLIEEHNALMRWKGMVTKVTIGILTGLGGLVTFLISKYLGE
jgi:hypothetical protein